MVLRTDGRLQRMKPPRKYASATAFRIALEDRLKHVAQEENIELQRLRRQVAFDRLLCRLFTQSDAPWLLKGGYAMELRITTGAGKQPCQGLGGFGAPDRTSQDGCGPSGKSNSRYLSTSKNPQSSDRSRSSTRIMGGAVFGNGVGMWHRSGHRKTFRRG